MLVLRSFVIAISIVFVGFTGAQASSMDFTLDELVAEGSASCKGDFTLDDDAVQRFDFNSDGEFDLVVLDESGFSCEDSASMYCGTAGCTVHLITAVDYSSGYVRNWELVRTEADQPVIFFSLHGMSCGEAGTTPCYDVISIFEGRFIGTAK
jgi:hypothetical protein